MRWRSAGVSAGDGRLLDDLLMPPLDRALALEEVDDVPWRVGEDLDLDVAGMLDEPLDVERAVAERAPASRRAASKRLAQSSRVAGRVACLCPPPPADALTAAESRSPRRRRNAPVALVLRRIARHHRHAGALPQFAAADLRSHRAIASGGGPMNIRPGVSAGAANAAFSDRNP